MYTLHIYIYIYIYVYRYIAIAKALPLFEPVNKTTKTTTRSHFWIFAGDLDSRDRLSFASYTLLLYLCFGTAGIIIGFARGHIRFHIYFLTVE